MKALHRVGIAALAAIAAAAAHAGGGLFSSDRPLTLELKAPFNDLFANARDDDSYSVTGTLTYSEGGGRKATLDHVTIALRGHTSRRESECAFPKLKLSLDGADDDPLFGGRSTVKIGTHCDDQQDGLTPRFGRLANERSPWREALAYRLLGALAVPTLKARPARVAYVFTDNAPTADGNGSASAAGAGPLVRNAMLLEDDDDARRRYGADKDISEQHFTSAAQQFSPGDTARIAFAEALLGNYDWCLRMTPGDQYRCDARHPLWNILAFATGSHATPVMYDFDVSGIVTGHHPWFNDVYNAAFVDTRSQRAVEVLGQLQRTRSLFTRAVLDETRGRFLARKAAAYGTLDDAAVDDEGRTIAREYLDHFFDTIGSDEAFYRPVVAARNVTAFRDARSTEPACGDRSVVPVGTPVSGTLDAQHERVRVMLLDTLWHWAPPNGCAAVHSGSVWIDANATSRDFPK